MNLVVPNLAAAPGARVIVNSLYDSTDPAVLTQDLLLVGLPGGEFIDVSWFPEHDPAGSYVVTLLKDGTSRLDREAGTAADAAAMVEWFAELMTMPIATFAASSSSYGKFVGEPIASAAGVPVAQRPANPVANSSNRTIRCNLIPAA